MIDYFQAEDKFVIDGIVFAPPLWLWDGQFLSWKRRKVAIFAKILGSFFNQFPLWVVDLINHCIAPIVGFIVSRWSVGKYEVYSSEPFRICIDICFNIDIPDNPQVIAMELSSMVESSVTQPNKLTRQITARTNFFICCFQSYLMW